MALCQALARIIKICTNPDPAKRFAGFGVLRALLAQAAHTHLGMKLEGTAGLEPSAADLTNQAIGLLQLQPGRSEGRRAIELLLQAILKSPDDLVALSWLRRQVATMNSRQILRLALYHCKHGMRTRRWWSRPLAGAALFAVLVFCSAEPWLIKLSAAALAALLAVEAYVSNLSLKKLNLFVYATAIVCALLYLLRRFGLPDDSQAWNLTGRGIWASLILCGFYWRGYRGLQREGRDVPSLRFAGLILPIVIFLGSARGFLFLVSYPLVTLLLWVILAYRNDWYVRSRRKQGIYRGQLWNRPLLETPPPTSQATIMVVVIIMLYGTIVVDYVHRH
jgi:hypothetical protein